MPQSLAQINVHLIFSTKYREKIIKPVTEPELFSYIGATINRMNGNPFMINGDKDHIHIFSTLPRTVSMAKFVEEIKRNSCRWIKTKDICYAQFSWQDGYAAFSVSSSHKKRVINYIARQKEHHGKQIFQDELLEFLRKHELDFDERYIWD